MFTGKYALCAERGGLPAISPPPPPDSAFRIGTPPLPAFFLLLLLLAWVVPPAAAQSPPTVSLQPSGMLTMMEHAVPTGVYFDSPETDGLNGARGIAASGDLLFVTGESDDALSVWQVNAEAGTLTQTDLHKGPIIGLRSAVDVAVSSDGALLFVTAQFLDELSVWRVNAEAGTLSQTVIYSGAGTGGLASSGNLLFVTADDAGTLSVWRVNAEAGTLSQTAIYQDRTKQNRIEGADGRFGGLDGAQDTAVSGDGNLLFVTANEGRSLSVWQVNAEAGTLSQTAIYQDNSARGTLRIAEVDGRVDGLRGATGLAISGNLLFVTANTGSALSTWRVNAEAGTLSQTALYQNGMGGINGLMEATGVAVSGNGELLFVTGRRDDALSVWRVNAEAGTLSQTALYRDSDTGIDGLSRAFGAAVSDDGDLLFVTGFAADALSAWQINNAEVPFGVPVMIRVQSDMPVDQQVTVTVTARNGADSVDAPPVTLSSGMLPDDAIFPAGTLGPGRWIFTAQASPPTALDTGAARIAMQVLPPLLSLEAQQDQFALGNTVTLTVRTAAWLEPASYEIHAIKTASGGTASITVAYSVGTTEQEVAFPAQDIASLGLGQLEFSIRLLDNSPFRVGDGSTAIVEIVNPRLRLVPQQERFVLGSMVTLTVQADAGAPRDATYNIIAENIVSVTPSIPIIVVRHPAGDTAREVSFSSQQIASAGQWKFSIQLLAGSPFQVDDGSNATVLVVNLQLRLMPLPEQLALGSTVTLTVRANEEAPTEVTHEITAENLTLPTTSPIPIEVIHPAGVIEREVSFSGQQINSPGQWEFSIQLPEGSPFQVTASGIATVHIAPVLSLRPEREFFPADVPVNIEVRADSPPAMDAAVTITARRQQDGVEVNAAETVMLSPTPEVLSGQVVFSTGTLGAGEWVFTAQSEPPQALYTANARAEATVMPPPPLILEVSAPLSVTVGSTFTVTVRVAEGTPPLESVSVTATVSFGAANSAAIAEREVTLTGEQSTATEEFTAPVTAGIFRVEISGPAEVSGRAVLGASASVTVEPVAVMLRLNGPTEAVSVGQDYTVMVDTVMPVPAGTTLTVTVTVSAGTELQEVVSLAEDIPEEVVSFTAPPRAGPVTVAATATVQTDADALEVAAADATTLAVAVSALDVQLVLSELPDLVAASSTFTVTVGTEPALPEGAKVMVTVSLGNAPGTLMELTASASTASVIVMAPTAGGEATLSATGEEAVDSRLELNVLAAEAVQVQVQLQVSLSLRLDAPPEVTARDSFAVTVFTEPEVPEGATVTVTVVFDGTDSSPVVLSAEMPSTAVIFTAPSSIENNLALMTSSVVTVVEPNTLQVMVADTDASVNAVAQSVNLTLMVSPQRVNIGEEIEVTVGVSPALLADTMLTVEVIAGTVPKAVTLTDATPSRQVRFPAMGAGPLEVRTQVLGVTPADLVTAENAPMQTVQVREQGTVELTLDAPKSVTVGSTFPVTVGVAAGTPLPEKSSVSATVSFRAADGGEIRAEAVVLSFGMSSDTLSFTAPVNSDIFVVEVRGRAGEDSPAIRFVVDTSAQVSVEPVRVMLTLGGPDAVTVNETYQVMVGTNIAVPEGTTLEVTVSDGTTSREVSLTEENAAEEVSFKFTAPASAGPVTVTATATVQTDTDALEVAAPAAKAVTVQVQLRMLRLELQQGQQPPTAGSTVILTVQLDRELPTTISYSVVARNTVSAMTSSVLTTHPADTTEHSVSFLGQQIASPGQWEFSISLPAESPFEGVPTMVTISLDFIQPQGIINADDLLFALRYLVRVRWQCRGMPGKWRRHLPAWREIWGMLCK